MSEKYTGTAMDRRYEGSVVDITYSAKRCIHAEECVQRLAAVFDNKRRPWILPDAAAGDSIAQVVEQCPSGALHYARKDGGASEAVPTTNTLHVWHDGPLQITGDLQIIGATVAMQGETRVTLCRCGASQHKPFCDNTHKQTGFDGTTQPATTTVLPNTEGGTLTITVNPSGSLKVEGGLTIYDEHGAVLFSGDKTWLCRCGGSSNKPFCDGTHKRNGFEAE